MQYEACGILYTNRDAAILALIENWCPIARLSQLAFLGETYSSMVNSMRCDDWLSRWEDAYGPLDDEALAGMLEEAVDDHREALFREHCADLRVRGEDCEGDTFECTGLELLQDNEDANEIREALAALLAGEPQVLIPGSLGVVLYLLD